MKKQIQIGLALSLSFILTLGLIKYFQISAAMANGASRVMPPTAVTTHLVKKESWLLSLNSVANLRAVQGTTISSEVSGRVSKINFQSGETVKNGALLLELDSSVEQAELAGATAQLNLAILDAERQRTLREKNANSQTDLDKAEALLKSAAAEVDRLKAVIGKKKILAPFKGRTGIRKVNLGQTLSLGEEIVSINSADLLYLDFSLPQDAVKNLKLGATVEFSVDVYEDKIFTSTLTAIESEIDPGTRNIWLQAKYENKDSLLLPGMFARASLILDKKQEVLAVPTSSISFAPYGDSIYVVLRGDTLDAPRDIRWQSVKLGRKLGDMTSVISGLKEGEEVVSSGAFRLRPGVKVVVNNEVQPGNAMKPDPRDT